MPYLHRTKHREIDTFDFHSIEKKNAIFQSDQTHKNREVERGRSAEL